MDRSPGYVSRGYFGTMQEGSYEVFMEVSQYISWLNSTILGAGGMASCSYMLTADPVLGKITSMRCAPQHSITQFEGTPPLRRKSSRGDIRWCTTDGRKGLQPQQRHHRGVLWPC